MSTNSLLTPCKQGAVLSRYSMALATFLCSVVQQLNVDFSDYLTAYFKYYWLNFR